MRLYSLTAIWQYGDRAVRLYAVCILAVCNDAYLQKAVVPAAPADRPELPAAVEALEDYSGVIGEAAHNRSVEDKIVLETERGRQRERESKK